jgi:hypothetical protein
MSGILGRRYILVDLFQPRGKELPIHKRQSTISSRHLYRQDHIEHPNADSFGSLISEFIATNTDMARYPAEYYILS